MRPLLARRAPGDSGSSAIELVLLTPVLIALVFAVIQAALLWHARHVALAAAQQGDRLARVAAVTTDDATIRAATVDYIHSLGADLVGDPVVTVTRAGGWATVTVTGRAVSLLPGATLPVHAVARGPVETFRPDTAAGAP
jgi:Flp pilus assembly protein TadG